MSTILGDKIPRVVNHIAEARRKGQLTEEEVYYVPDTSGYIRASVNSQGGVYVTVGYDRQGIWDDDLDAIVEGLSSQGIPARRQ